MNNYMKTIISGLKQWVSSQKSDWNQNDSSAVNFIKNRPFYSEEKEKVLFSGNISAENAWDNVYGAEGLAYGLSFTTGQIYKITFDNVEYLCECKLLNSEKFFGNTMILGEGEETEEPFFIGYSDNWGLCVFCLTEGTHSLSISGTVEEVHQIDKKFVPMPDLADVAHTGDYYDLQNTPYIPWDTVRYGTTQSLTEGNKKIARNNIGAAAATDVSSLNTTVSGLSAQIEDATDECITGLSVSGKVITYTKGDGSTGTITTQDTTYSNATTSKAGLMSTTDKTKVDKIATNLVNGSASGSLRSIYSSTEDSSYSLGQNAFAVGSNTKAFGHSSHAEGENTLAAGNKSHAEGYDTTASGYSSHTEGASTKASGSYSHAEGISTKALGSSSHAEGQQTTASGENSHAEGGPTYASGEASHAEGYWTLASGDYSHAEGYDTIAFGRESHAEGIEVVAFGQASHAEGGGSFSMPHLVGEANSTTYRIEEDTIPSSIQVNCIVSHNGVVAVITSIDKDNKTITLDKTLSSSALNQEVRIHTSGTAYAAYSHIEGYHTTALGYNSHAEGSNTVVSNYDSHAEGNYTAAIGAQSHAEGSGDYLTVILTGEANSTNYQIKTWNGYIKVGTVIFYGNCVAKIESVDSTNKTIILDKTLSDTALSEIQVKVYTSVASGSKSHIEGKSTIASGEGSHAEGCETIASGNHSHAEGYQSIASGGRSHAEGYQTTASGDHSHAEGYQTVALEDNSHAEGGQTTASGQYSHAEGRGQYSILHLVGEANSITYQIEEDTIPSSVQVNCVVSFGRAVAIITSIDRDNKTITLDKTLSNSALNANVSVHKYGVASGDYSHTEGQNTIASSDSSHAEGSYTIAASANQHVQGRFNIENSNNKYAHIVGNGESDSARSNAHTLDWDGNAWFAGNIYVGGTGQDDAAAVEVALKSDLASLSAPTAISLTRIDEICNQTIYSTNEVTF